MNLLIKISIGTLNIIYFFFKLNKTRRKILFLSRQHNHPSIDFILLEKAIKEEDPSFETFFLCKKIGKGLQGKIKYGFHILSQMRHISQSKAVIIDGYSITCSVLKHKKDLQIIQIWHALGAIKKFGCAIIDMKEGTSSKIAELMKMHKNYTKVLVGSEAFLEAYEEGFDIAKDKLEINPLPTVDLLRDKDYISNEKEKIIAVYPNLDNMNKKNVVYAPTFRDGQNDFPEISKLAESIDKDKYNLIIKAHPLMNLRGIDEEGVLVDEKFSTLSMMMAAHIVITDYSALAFDAAVLDINTCYFVYDFEEYTENRDFNIDYMKEMPGPIFKDYKEINKVLEDTTKGAFRDKRIAFRDKYLALQEERQANLIAKSIIKDIK